MTGKIYAAIAAVSAEAGALAPTKNGAGVPFAFRGVDATVAHVAPFLKKHNIIVVPEVTEYLHTRYDIGNKALTQTELRTAFHFIHTEDGSEVVATTAGLAQDFSDRSAAQAQSVAFRVAILQTFTLPTHDREPEEVGEDVIKTTQAEKSAQRQQAAKAAAPARKTAAQLNAEIGKLIQTGVANAGAVEAYGNEISREPRATWQKDGAILERVLAKFSA